MPPSRSDFSCLWLRVLERIIPDQVTMLLWSVLLIGSAVYIGALERLGTDATGWRKLWKSSGLVMLIYGILLMIGAAGGGDDVLQPLRGTRLPFVNSTPSNQALSSLKFKHVKNVEDIKREITLATAAKHPVMLDFYADWCFDCKRMEKRTFTDAGVHQALENAILLQADVTANDTEDKDLLKFFGLPGPPATLFFTAQGSELRQYRLIGFLEPEKFRQHVENALTLNL